MTQPIRADGVAVHCAHTRIVPTNTLRPNPRNPNRHGADQIKLFAQIIEKLGWRSPIVVSLRSGLIVKGHGRLEVARHMQLREVPIDEQPYLDEAAETQDMLADNRITELSERDETEVANLLKSLASTGADMAATGYADKDVTRLLGILETQGKETESIPGPDQAEILQAKWKVKQGDIWQCGDHRLACGSATNPDCWRTLMHGDRAQLVHTDPPYGVDYKDSKGVGIQGDSLRQDDLMALIRSALKLAVEHSFTDAAFYIWHASSTRRDFEHAIDAAGLQERQYLTWVKDSFVMGRADYHWQTEPCFYCEKAGHRAKFTGDRAQATVWRLNMTPNDGTAVALANGLHITDGATGQLFIRANKPKSQKARHIRLEAGQSIQIADRAISTAWEIARDDRKEYLHPCLPAGEMVLTAGKWRPVEYAQIGQETPYGHITDTSSHTAHHIVTITLEDGTATKATGNHPFLILRDNTVLWLEARHIQPGDKTLTARNVLGIQKPCPEEHQQKDQSPPKDTAESTTQSKNEPEWSMSSSGKQITDASKQDGRYTISTETNSIIEFPISNLLLPLNTNGYTPIAVRTPTGIGKSHVRPAANSSPQHPSTGILLEAASQAESAEPATATARSPLAKFELRRVGNVAHEHVPTTVYNLTIEGIPAFDTLIGVSHNTQKPAELAAIPVMNNTNTGDIVVDCFAGSHSTLIACELLHRRARTIDFEPKFVAVGLERWARLTNREPVLIS